MPQARHERASPVPTGEFSFTWDDFMKICAAVSKAPDAYCYEMNTDASRFAAWVWSRGGSMLSPDNKTVAFNGQPGLDSLTFLDQLFKN